MLRDNKVREEIPLADLTSLTSRLVHTSARVWYGINGRERRARKRAPEFLARTVIRARR